MSARTGQRWRQSVGEATERLASRVDGAQRAWINVEGAEGGEIPVQFATIQHAGPGGQAESQTAGTAEQALSGVLAEGDPARDLAHHVGLGAPEPAKAGREVAGVDGRASAVVGPRHVPLLAEDGGIGGAAGVCVGVYGGARFARG